MKTRILRSWDGWVATAATLHLCAGESPEVKLSGVLLTVDDWLHTRICIGPQPIGPIPRVSNCFNRSKWFERLLGTGLWEWRWGRWVFPWVPPWNRFFRSLHPKGDLVGSVVQFRITINSSRTEEYHSTFTFSRILALGIIFFFFYVTWKYTNYKTFIPLSKVFIFPSKLKGTINFSTK